MSPALVAMLLPVAVAPAIAYGIRAAIALWRLRHPDIPEPVPRSGTEDL